MSNQSGKLMPNLDQQSTKVLNLTVLQRMDPYIEEILITAAHVTFYAFNIDLNQWSRKDVEGSLFVVKRNTQPRFQFIVMNRRNTENLVENLLGDFEFELQVPYLLYRNASQEVNGIWFYNSRECEDVANLFTSSVLLDGSNKGVPLSADDEAHWDRQSNNGGLTHYAELLVESALCGADISSLSPAGATKMEELLAKKLALAESGQGFDTQKFLKNKGKGAKLGDDGEPKVPVFLEIAQKADAKLPTGPFIPNWGIRNRDTVVGTGNHSIEWSSKSITPCDRQGLVEGLNTEQIESMLCQSIAATNLYGQASIERLKLLEKDILVRDKEIKTYRDDAGIWKTRFEASEEEAAILKTKLQRVEAAAAREREELQAEIIAEYKRSDEFAALTVGAEKEDEDDDEDDDSQLRTGWKLAFKRIAENHPDFIISDVEYPQELDVEELQALMSPADAFAEHIPLLTDFTAEDTEIPDADVGDADAGDDDAL